MYVTDFKRDENGHYVLDSDGAPQLETEANKQYGVYAGNMNSKWQMGWSNTIRYKDFSLFFLINGRIGGKVISFTEAYLDGSGLSERTAEARQYAEQHNLIASDYGSQPGMYLPMAVIESCRSRLIIKVSEAHRRHLRNIFITVPISVCESFLWVIRSVI